MKAKIKKIFLIGVVAVVILIMCLKLFHEVRLAYEGEEVQSLLQSKIVQVDGGRIHTVIKEEVNAEDTVVFLHGLGMGDTTVTAQPLLGALKTEHNLFVMDRYGNGLSSDSNKAQTVEEIVELYRQVLQQTNQKTQYVLIAHSVSGIYATYWAQKYPEEIKAVIYLDADPVECYLQEGEIDKLSMVVGQCQCVLSKMGFQRIFATDEALLGQTENQIFTEEQNRLRKYLVYHNTCSKATCSEMELYYENAQIVSENGLDLSVPQLYIVANMAEGEYYNNIYADTLSERYNGDVEKMQEERNYRLQLKEEKKKYRSNAEIVEISGPHCLYEYDPQGIATAIDNFLQPIH